MTSIRRIPLRNPVFDYEGHNNAYVIESGGRVGVVDTAVASAETRETLERGLTDAGHDIASVDALFLTHWHPDHAGLAGEIQRESGAAAYVHEADVPILRHDPAALGELSERRRELIERFGLPPGKHDALTETMGEPTEEDTDRVPFGEYGGGDPVAVEPVADGDVVEFGDAAIEVVHTPGHTAGSACFVLEDGTAFTGDTLLPEYTPNIGGSDVRIDRPLERYLDSLRRFAAVDVDRGRPGHRDAIDDPARRAAAIVRHHERRTDTILGLVEEEGPIDAWTLSGELFGDLDGVHLFLGPAEAVVHLDYLARNGLVEHTPAGYRRTETAARIERLFPTID